MISGSDSLDLHWFHPNHAVISRINGLTQFLLEVFDVRAAQWATQLVADDSYQCRHGDLGATLPDKACCPLWTNISSVAYTPMGSIGDYNTTCRFNDETDCIYGYVYCERGSVYNQWITNPPSCPPNSDVLHPWRHRYCPYHKRPYFCCPDLTGQNAKLKQYSEDTGLLRFTCGYTQEYDCTYHLTNGSYIYGTPYTCPKQAVALIGDECPGY